MKRITLLFLLLISLFVHNSLFAQNEIPYHIDTNFTKKLRTYYDELSDYECANLWIKRIDETIEKKLFHDFVLACRNYNKVISSKMDIDSFEVYTQKLFNHLGRANVADEYKIILSYSIDRNSFRYFNSGSESRAWLLDGKPLYLNYEVQVQLTALIDKWRGHTLESLAKYHFPYSFEQQSFLHFFLSNYDYQTEKEDAIRLMQYLSDYYKTKGYWKEYVSITNMFWSKIGNNNIETWFDEAERFEVNEYVSFNAISLGIEYLYGKKERLMNLDLGTYNRFVQLITNFKQRFPNSIFIENISKFEIFLNAKHFTSKLFYHDYNTPTIIKIDSYQADTLYYYHFTKHDSRKGIRNFGEYTFHQKGMWLKDAQSGVLNTDLYAIPAVQAAQNYLIISDREIIDFSVFDTTSLLKISFPYGVVVHAWDEVPYAIKRTEEKYAGYLVVQDKKTGKAVPRIAIYNEVSGKLGQTNAQGIVSHKLQDSLVYMVCNTDTFSVDTKRYMTKFTKEPLFFWDDLVDWFDRFERYSKEDRREDTEFRGFTDRSRYRPGDTVFYKAYAYLNDHRVDDQKFINYYLKTTKVKLRNPDDKTIATDTVSINKRHAVNGFFIIPKDTKLGRHEIYFDVQGGYSYSRILSFNVEDYVDEKYLLKLGNIETAYRIGDTVEFLAYVESRTRERIPGVKIVVQGDSLLTSEGVTDINGEFPIKLIVNDEEQTVVVQAYLNSGEVLNDRKWISKKEESYRVRQNFVAYRKTKINISNHDDILQPDTVITILHLGKKKASAYDDLKGMVHFSKSDFVKWYPLALTKGDTIVKRQVLHTSDTIAPISEAEYKFIRIVVHGDTLRLNQPYESRRGKSSVDFLTTSTEYIKKGLKTVFYTNDSHLTYLKRRRNGHFNSRNIDLSRRNQYSFLTRQFNKEHVFELFPQDGHISVQKIEAKKKVHWNNPRLSLVWDGLPEEIYPGESYTIGLRVKKRNHYVRPEMTIAMMKYEHAPSYFYLQSQQSKTEKRFYRDAYKEQYYIVHWQWISANVFNREFTNSSLFSKLNKIEKYKLSSEGEVTFESMPDPSALKVDDVIRRSYLRPLIDRDGAAAGSISGREDIAKLPVRSASGVVSTVQGVNEISIRGSRSDESYYYIDGVKVRGSSDLALSDLEEVTIATGGAAASFGAEEGGIDQEDDMLSFDQIRERNRFGDTQFFIPQVKRKGKRYEVTFTQNDEITAWQLVAVAGTRNYQYAQGRQRLISVQPVQLIENTPRFVRVGDTVVIGGNVFNRTGDTLSFKPTLNIYQSVTKANLNTDFGVQEHSIIKVAPNAVQSVEWKVNIPTYYLKTLNLEMAVAGKQFGDRFNKSIPVLQRKGIYEVGQTFVKVEEDTLQFVLNKETYLSETAEILDANFYVNGNKEIEYLIQRGKALENPTLITSTGLASNWALVAELHEMISAKPALKVLLDREYKAVLDSIDVNKNEALKVLEFSNRLFVIMQLQELADAKQYEDIAKKRSTELVKFLDEKGEFKWLQQSEKGSVWTTRSVIRSLAKIKYLKFPVEEQLYDKWAKVIEEELKLYLESKEKGRFWSWRLYYELDDYAVLKDNWSAELNEVWQCFVAEKWQDAGTTAQLYFANLALKMKDSTFAKQIAKSILSYTSYSKSKGRFIPKQSRGSELENQAELILLLEKLGGYNREIVQLQQYMQIHQDYNNWSSRAANAGYLRALICGPSQEHLLNKNATIIINQKRTDVVLTKNHAIEVDVEQNTYDIKVISHPDLVVTGGFKVKFTDDMEKVNRSTDDRLRMERFIYFKVGDDWKLATENSVIPLGSAIRMDIVFAASNEFSELVVELPRITGLEFTNSRSGYRYGQVSYYAELKNEVVKLYVDRIRDGKSTISLEGVVTNAGAFLFAPSSLTSERNPEIGVTDKSLKVKIER